MANMSRVFAAAAAVGFASILATSCSDKADGEGNTFPSPCDSDLQGLCGSDCTDGGTCPAGLYCQPATGTCTADCSAASPCPAGYECTSSGKCNNGSGGSGGTISIEGGPGDGGIGADACATGTAEAKLQPLALYIMLDKSGSMDDGSPTKWSQAVAALRGFVDDPNSAGIKVALQYFSISNGQCSGQGYNQAAVAMGDLPMNANAIKQSLNNTNPSGGTPTEGALRGILSFCRNYNMANPSEKCVGLFVSDGEPNGCQDTNLNALANIAGTAFNSTPSIPVYSMGMDGADFNFMDNVADRGGTTQAFNATSAAAFQAALEAIRGQQLSCDFPMPTSSSGDVDPNKVEIEFTNGAGQTESFVKVNGASDCMANGWYYDNPANPTRIMLCPATCTKVQNDEQGKIQIQLGCIVPPPP